MYRAVMRSSGGLETVVAVKVLHRTGHLPPGAEARLRDEARFLSRIHHPVVVQALALVWIEDRPALVTEYVPGMDLAECLLQQPKLEVRALLELIGQVAAGLEVAHGLDGDGSTHPVIHRDVKPSNIRVGHHGQVRLLDFGIALSADPERRADTRTDVVVGSVPYMAPERFLERHSTPAVDIYGLGCCLFEALVGERLHAEASMRELASLALSAERHAEFLERRLARLSPGSGTHFDLLRRSLSHRARDRPDAGEIADICERAAAALPGPTLKRWCAQAAWPPASELEGALTGQTVTDRGPPPSANADGPQVPPGPRIVHEAPVTAEPSAPQFQPANAPKKASSQRTQQVEVWAMVATGCATLAVGAGLLVAAAFAAAWM